MSQENLTLSELLLRIKTGLKSILPDSYWIVAEIGEIHTNHSGHCYLELIEKDDEGDSIKAKMRATIWSYQYRLLKPYFETTTGQKLVEGLKILTMVSIEFHELYGASLNISDIDPTYTIGEQEKKRREILERLQSEGIIDMNKAQDFPELPKNIAIISSETAAGYGDFKNQLTNNTHGYKFHTKLFPATMQGDKAEDSIINALDSIYPFCNLFDVVVIIRGGGSQSDLSCFDTYWLAANIAQFPIPVLTGIGHDRDESIADIVAHQSLKTPTAVADFLLQFFDIFTDDLSDLLYNFIHITNTQIQQNHQRIANSIQSLSHIRSGMLQLSRQSLKYYLDNLKTVIEKQSLTQSSLLNNHKRNTIRSLDSCFEKMNFEIQRKYYSLQSTLQTHKLKSSNILALYEERIKQHDPEKILKKGYSITLNTQGKPVRNSKELKEGDLIKTVVSDGSFHSKVIK